ALFPRFFAIVYPLLKKKEAASCRRCPRLPLPQVQTPSGAYTSLVGPLVSCPCWVASRACCKRRTTSTAPLRYTVIQTKAPSLAYTAQYRVLPYRVICMASIPSSCCQDGQGKEYLPCPVPLLTLAPTLGRLMRPPGAVLAIAELHLYAVLTAPAFGLYMLAFRLLLCGETLQQHF